MGLISNLKKVVGYFHNVYASIASVGLVFRQVAMVALRVHSGGGEKTDDFFLPSLSCVVPSKIMNVSQ